MISGATGEQQTHRTHFLRVMREAANHKDPVMHVIFTVRRTVHTVAAYRPSGGGGYIKKATAVH